MPVVGMHAFVLSSTGKTTTVSAYSPEHEPKTLPIVDADVQYQCPYSGTNFILVILSAIHVPAMENNLICIMKSGAIHVVNQHHKLDYKDMEVTCSVYDISRAPQCTRHDLVKAFIAMVCVEARCQLDKAEYQ